MGRIIALMATESMLSMESAGRVRDFVRGEHVDHGERLRRVGEHIRGVHRDYSSISSCPAPVRPDGPVSSMLNPFSMDQGPDVSHVTAVRPDGYVFSMLNPFSMDQA